MTSLSRTRIFFDVETTGLDYIKNEIITACFTKDDGSYINLQSRPLRKNHWTLEAQKIHGITWDEASSFTGREFVKSEIYKFFHGSKGELWAHCNPNGDSKWFDFSFLWEFLGEKNGEYNIRSRFKTYTTISLLRNFVHKGLLPPLKTNGRISYKLPIWANYFDIKLNHHDAQSDTLACLNIWKNCYEIFKTDYALGRVDKEDWDKLKGY